VIRIPVLATTLAALAYRCIIQLAALVMGETRNHEYANNMHTNEPQAGASSTAACGKQRADQFLHDLANVSGLRLSRLDVLNRRKRLESECKKALDRRRQCRTQLVKLKRDLDDIETDIARLEAEIHSVELEWDTASDRPLEL